MTTVFGMGRHFHTRREFIMGVDVDEMWKAYPCRGDKFTLGRSYNAPCAWCPAAKNGV